MEINTEYDTVVAFAMETCPVWAPALAMTYSPQQAWEDVHNAEIALARGTIFPALEKPFLEGACTCV